jgi:hypothetical protein
MEGSMSKAYRCDKCKTLFEKNTNKLTFQDALGTINIKGYDLIVELKFYTNSPDVNYPDLCSKCKIYYLEKTIKVLNTRIYVQSVKYTI